MVARSFQFRGYTIWRDPVFAYFGEPAWFAALEPEALPDTDESPFPDEPEYFRNMASPQEAMRRINEVLGYSSEPSDPAYWEFREEEDYFLEGSGPDDKDPDGYEPVQY